MDKDKFIKVFWQAIEDDGRALAIIADQAGVDEANIRTIRKGHCPNPVRSDAILRAIGRKVVLGRGRALDIDMGASRLPTGARRK